MSDEDQSEKSASEGEEEEEEELSEGEENSTENSPVAKKRRAEPPAADNDAEEEEDDEEEEEETQHRRKKRRRHNEFIMDEVEVDDDDEEEEYMDGDEVANESAEAEAEAARLSSRKVEGVNRLGELWKDHRSEEEIEKYFHERYGSRGAQERTEGVDMLDEDICQQALLPSTKDPTLYMVKCTMGDERQIALRLMRMCLTYQNTDNPLQIKSIVVKEGLKGALYVEAFKDQYVLQLIEKCSSLRRNGMTRVPIKEMADTMRVVKDIPKLKEKTWVRLKRTMYKDDIAQVDWVEVGQNLVHLRLVPRIDYTRMRKGMRGSEGDAKKPAKKIRPNAKLFDVEAIKAIGGEVNTDGEYLIFEGGRYSHRGFLYKPFPMNAIIVEGVKPTLSELERFQETAEDLTTELMSTTIEEKVHNFAPGDNVEVAEGELKNLTGKIISVEGDKIHMLPDHAELKDSPLTFDSKDLQKFFKAGDHVKVISGRFEGDTGLIAKVESNTIVLFSDLSMHEVRVLAKEVQLCTDVASGVDTVGQYQWGDLVQLDPQTVGIIVRLEKEHFQILNMHGKLLRVKHAGIHRNVACKFAEALDCDGIPIRAEDTVKVMDGPHSGRQGEIRHIYRSFVFIFCRTYPENGGMFVCRSRHLVKPGGKSQNSSPNLGGLTPFMRSPAAGMMSPSHGAVNRPKQPGGQQQSYNSVGPGGGGGGIRRDMKIIGKDVKIIGGPHKGSYGIVKDATDQTAKVELHSGCKPIVVDKSRLQVVGAPVAGGMSSYDKTPRPESGKTPIQGGRTPMHGSMTPMYGSQTPMHEGSRTPYYGSQTPRHDGSMTPGHGNAWDPTVANTPARQSPLDDFEYQHDSPAPASNDPAISYAPATPGVGMYGDYSLSSPYGNGSVPSVQQPSPAGSMPVPSPAGSYGHGSNSSSYVAPSPLPFSPSPMMNPSSISSMGYTNSPFNLVNPSPGVSGDHSYDDWSAIDIEVRIKDTHEDRTYHNYIGVIKNVSGGMCTVVTPEDGRVTSVQVECLEPIRPVKGDKIKVIKGDDRETVGELLSIDGSEGVVKTDTNDIKLFSLESLCKMYAGDDFN